MKRRRAGDFRQPAGRPAGFFVLLAAVFWFGRAQAGEPEIGFLHVRFEGGRLEVLSHEIRPGRFKEETREAGHGYSWELLKADGTVARSGTVPPEERIEYPAGGGEIGAIAAPAAEWIIRMPAEREARRFRLLRSGGEGLRRQADSEVLAETEAPAPGARRAFSAVPSKLVTLLTNGPAGNRLNAVILAEGFRASEEESFLTNANKVLNKLLATAPYATLRSHFNGYAIFVPSNESGADHPSKGIFRDTYFSASFESSGIDRLLTIPPNSFNSNFADGRGRAFALLQKHVPDYDLAMMLVNDTEYGGSGGTPALASLSPSSADIIVHELGHSFAGLGDEYDSPANYPDTEEPNTTRETRRDFIKWKAWIEPSTPVPTPETAAYSRVVGLFEGAHYHATGWYRPKLDCAMRSLGAPFCEVCSETLILASYSRVNMLDAVAPTPGPVQSTREAPARLGFTPVPGLSKEARFVWRANGTELAAGPEQILDFGQIYANAGAHQIQLEARDTTAAVRHDPLGHLVETASWPVTVVSSATPAVSGAVVREGAGGRAVFASTHLARLVLERSADLANWIPVRTNAPAREMETIVGANPGAEFYRARALPAF